MPATVDILVAEVADRCGLALADAMLYVRDVDGDGNPITPAILRGLRKGLRAISLVTIDPIAIQDADLACVSGFALERVLDEAELFALQQALSRWWLVTQCHKQATSTAIRGDGWLEDQKQAVKNRVAELKAICDEPYREPSGQFVVGDDRRPFGYPFGYPSGWREGGCWS